MKKEFKKALIVYGIGFMILFLLRLLYGYLSFDSQVTSRRSFDNVQYMNNNAEIQQSYDAASEGYSSKLNKASAKRIYQKKDGGSAVQNISVEQKFEKVATIKSVTNKFEETSKKLKEEIAKYNAIIQYEQSSGLKGDRYLDLTIGVDPEKFDDIVAAIQQIGVVKAININKIDKTSEYKDLQAKRKSLEESMNSLSSLKNRGGKIDEYINLENQILDIKKQIQDLGIKLGDYDEENELCTVKFNLQETSFAKYSFVRSVKISFVWAIKIYFFITLGLFMVIGGVALLVFVLDKLNLLNTIKGWCSRFKK